MAKEARLGRRGAMVRGEEGASHALEGGDGAKCEGGEAVGGVLLALLKLRRAAVNTRCGSAHGCCWWVQTHGRCAIAHWW